MAMSLFPCRTLVHWSKSAYRHQISIRVVRNHAFRDKKPLSSVRFRRQSTAANVYDYTLLQVDQERLMKDLHHTCQWGTGEKWGSVSTETGMSRLALSDTDRQARDWFVETTKSLGCEITIDQMGNTFAVRKGKRDGLATMAGSHLDTQPTGGRYDGILGVTAAVEMLRVLEENSIETEYPVGVINWTNEEGARFPMSMVSSGVWAQEIPLEKAHNLASVTRGESATMKSELERIGYLGTTPCNHETFPIAAHFELHIEQGPILEKEKRKIGIVTGVQAYRWYTISVQGRDCHTGTTDMLSRADALLAAAKMIVAGREYAYHKGVRVSTGILEAKPGSTNTVPGAVNFSLDVRGKSNELVIEAEKELKSIFENIASGQNLPTCLQQLTHEAHPDVCFVSWRQDFYSPTVNFHDDCIQCVTEASQDIFQEKTSDLTKIMLSNAGHDSVNTNKRVPTSMIFVPSKDGVSHHPTEYTAPEDCALGATVLMKAVLKYDQLRAKRA